MKTPDYALLVSGHGSPYRYDGLNPKTPTVFLNWEEALTQADRWEGLACTIGGRALIEHTPTGTLFTPQGNPVTSGVLR